MDKYQLMTLYCLAGLVVKDTGESVESFLADAETFANLNLEKPQDDLDKAVDAVYKAYPTKCPNRGMSTGKGAKDRAKVASLLKSGKYSVDQLIRIINKYVDETTSHGGYLKNFSSFLNNIPEPEPEETFFIDQQTDTLQ